MNEQLVAIDRNGTDGIDRLVWREGELRVALRRIQSKREEGKDERTQIRRLCKSTEIASF